ncbi:hypothetical protein [Natrinema sp. 1APR25-10V2]|uniref:hypothetical protein n=1 Tax=Natrinema sp. 1APR25-10V2 TaxID=2951081 RepID=UPI0028769A44|nr:hypothetical protein [Natrinema sp. 1APR25-10V2]MDS0475214.1 hypothetical protein [Natrinema sp. 1APR25-10V2]
MGFHSGVLNGLAALTVIVFVGRAVVKLLQNPEKPHRELVSARERRATTAVGIPLALVGLSTMAGGPLAVPVAPFALLAPGIVLLVYPEFAPSSV